MFCYYVFVEQIHNFVSINIHIDFLVKILFLQQIALYFNMISKQYLTLKKAATIMIVATGFIIYSVYIFPTRRSFTIPNDSLNILLGR